MITKNDEMKLHRLAEYIWKNTTDILSKDLRDNIILVVTFSDFTEPLIIETIRGVGVQIRDNWYCFNNGPLFERIMGNGI